MKISVLNIILLSLLLLIFSKCETKKTKIAEPRVVKRDLTLSNKYDSTFLEDAFKKLNSGNFLSQHEIDSFSKSIVTRADFYDLLSEFNQEDNFPQEYNNFEKAGESVLANWLAWPTELDTIPSQIELLKRVVYKSNDSSFIYYVYQFKTEKPHWASKKGWMIGVVGPYFSNSNPYDWATGTFSRLMNPREISPEKEVEWTHKNIYKRRPK